MLHTDVDDRAKVLRACDALSEDPFEGVVYRQAMQMIWRRTGIAKGPELVDLTAKLVQFLDAMTCATSQKCWKLMKEYLDSDQCQQHSKLPPFVWFPAYPAPGILAHDL